MIDKLFRLNKLAINSHMSTKTYTTRNAEINHGPLIINACDASAPHLSALVEKNATRKINDAIKYYDDETKKCRRHALSSFFPAFEYMYLYVFF